MSTIPVSQLEVPLPRTEVEPTARRGEVDFAHELNSALASVEGAQQEADLQVTKAAEGGGNLHELSLSLEKADIAMRVAMKIRNKVVDAYHEVMRMSV